MNPVALFYVDSFYFERHMRAEINKFHLNWYWKWNNCQSHQKKINKKHSLNMHIAHVGCACVWFVLRYELSYSSRWTNNKWKWKKKNSLIMIFVSIFWLTVFWFCYHMRECECTVQHSPFFSQTKFQKSI